MPVPTETEDWGTAIITDGSLSEPSDSSSESDSSSSGAWHVFAITNLQLGTAFSVYGIVAMLAYFPGGALADRFSARTMMTSALVVSALGGIWTGCFILHEMIDERSSTCGQRALGVGGLALLPAAYGLRRDPALPHQPPRGEMNFFVVAPGR